ncbi:MAG: hypothetical protein LQ343_007328 [Gyalolechia ehrenbergii]|nr:MAG: hypothetical protein LQ343_007328 [Gyalolechia ehrenbergii]
MCVRYFLSDTFNITNSAIETLPVHLASQIWLEIKKSQLDSLRVWKIFVSAFGNQLGKSLIHKRVILRDPPSDLSECISHIVSPRFDWVTFLTLAHVPFSRTDVIQVARLTNLGKLSLGPHSNGDIGLDDSIVRAWSRAASEAKAFTKLRILTCRSHVNITGQIFAYFQEFPALGLICVDNPNASSAFKDQAEEYCWFLMKDEVLRESAFAAHASTWQQVYDNCFEDGVFKPENLEKGSGRNGGVQPTLDLTLGLRHDRYCMRVVDTVQDRKRAFGNRGEVEVRLPKKRVIRPSQQRALNDLMGNFERQGDQQFSLR